MIWHNFHKRNFTNSKLFSVARSLLEFTKIKIFEHFFIIRLYLVLNYSLILCKLAASLVSMNMSVPTSAGVQNCIASMLRCLPGCVVTGSSQVNFKIRWMWKMYHIINFCIIILFIYTSHLISLKLYQNSSFESHYKSYTCITFRLFDNH